MRLLVVMALSALAMQPAAQPEPLTVKALESALAANPQGDDAARLADRIRTFYGGRNELLRGLPPKIDELTVAWAIELAEPPPAGALRPAVVRDVGNTR